jgi:hypothetical protein
MDSELDRETSLFALFIVGRIQLHEYGGSGGEKFEALKFESVVTVEILNFISLSEHFRITQRLIREGVKRLANLWHFFTGGKLI